MLLEPPSVAVTREERRLLRRLVLAGAVTPLRAHPLPLLSRSPAGWTERLEAAGLLRRAEGERFYVDEAVYRRLITEQRRRRILAVVTAFVLLIGLLLLWMDAGF